MLCRGGGGGGCDLNSMGLPMFRKKIKSCSLLCVVRLKAPFQTQSDDPISLYGKPAELTDEIAYRT